MLPLHTKSVRYGISSVSRRERNQIDKDFFIRFQIKPEDVSSGSGRISGWLPADAVPIKGTIADVVFFGDLWGDLIQKQIVRPHQRVRVPASIKAML